MAVLANEKDSAHVQGLPPRAFLDATVTPVLLEGLKAVAQERYIFIGPFARFIPICRPPNPLEYLGLYLLRNANALKAGATQ